MKDLSVVFLGGLMTSKVWKIAFALLVSSFASAAELNSFCYSLPLSSKVEGTRVHEIMPIASVAKLVTSYWAVKTKGLDYRFQTVIYVSPVSQSPGVFDLHFQGSRDPYFGAEKLHYLISELNQRGITSVRNMTFDENFKFLWFADDPESNKPIATGFYINSAPSSQEVLKQLRAFSKLTQGYEETRDRARKLKVELTENPVLSIQNFEFVNSRDFIPSSQNQIFTIASKPMGVLLKEMNRNSNNHAANQIFEHMGSSDMFQDFLKSALDLDLKSVVMLNGSGDRVDTPQGARYNSATCSAMIQIIADLHKTLHQDNRSFKDIMTVVGTESGTATQLYNTELTFDAVIAKTGTVNPAVTLAGVASTKQGLVYFMFNAKPNQNFGKARELIRNELQSLMEKFGGPVRLSGSPFRFFSFDASSFSKLETDGEWNP